MSELSKICIMLLVKVCRHLKLAGAATYYDKKAVDDELQVVELVHVLAPRNKSKKLALKWSGLSEIVKCCHLACEILVSKNAKLVTRDKLK